MKKIISHIHVKVQLYQLIGYIHNVIDLTLKKAVKKSARFCMNACSSLEPLAYALGIVPGGRIA